MAVMISFQTQISRNNYTQIRDRKMTPLYEVRLRESMCRHTALLTQNTSGGAASEAPVTVYIRQLRDDFSDVSTKQELCEFLSSYAELSSDFQRVIKKNRSAETEITKMKNLTMDESRKALFLVRKAARGIFRLKPNAARAASRGQVPLLDCI